MAWETPKIPAPAVFAIIDRWRCSCRIACVATFPILSIACHRVLPALSRFRPASSSRLWPRWPACVLLCVLVLVLGPGGRALAEVPAFSAMAAGADLSGWAPYTPAPQAPATVYTLVPDPADPSRTVLRAQADRSMSGVAWTGRVRLQDTPLLRWRWRVAAPVADADLNTREGDDYAARVYVLFDVPRATLPLATRAQLRLVEVVSGQQVPTAAINYVWDNQAPVGTVQPNAYTDRARMWVLQSGADRAGQWVEETRDLAADFERAFGGTAPDVVGIALATDTDNTAGTATAWYGDLRFLPAHAAASGPNAAAAPAPPGTVQPSSGPRTTRP